MAYLTRWKIRTPAESIGLEDAGQLGRCRWQEWIDILAGIESYRCSVPMLVPLLWNSSLGYHPQALQPVLMKSSVVTHIPSFRWISLLLASEVAQLCLTLCDSMDCRLLCSSIHGIFIFFFFNTGVSNSSFLQGIFTTQGSNPSLLRNRQILYQLSHKGRLDFIFGCSQSHSKLRVASEMLINLGRIILINNQVV